MDVFHLFLVLRWNTELCPKYVAGGTFSVSVQGRIVHSNIYGFFDGSSHVVLLPAYNSEVLHSCYVAIVILKIKNW